MKNKKQIIYIHYALTLFLGAINLLSAKESMVLPEIKGQIVRIELPGTGKTLSLAEVEVYAKGVNHAQGKQATQSTVAHGGEAVRAVDGNTDGQYGRRSVTHTEVSENPWWQVDLGSMLQIEEIILYNRTDYPGTKLEGFTLKVLDNKGEVVFSQTNCAQKEEMFFLQKGIKSSYVARKKKTKNLKAKVKISGADKDLGAIWFIGDSITQSNADGDPNGSPRKALYDLLKANGYSFTYTGNHAVNPDGLPKVGDGVDNLYHYHSGVSGILIGDENCNGFRVQLKKYWGQGRLAKVKPDTILIMIGTNDIGRPYELDDAPKRLRALIEEIYTLPNVGKPKVFLATIPPNRRIEADRTNVMIFNESIPRIVQDFKTKGRKIYAVDQFKALDADFEKNMLGDRLHTNKIGNVTMAKEWFKAIESAQKDKVISGSSGDQLFPGEKKDFKGYDMYSFRINNRTGVQIVCPKKEAPGKPWLWRSLFWEALGQVNEADLKLVEEGYHVVIAHGDVAGHPSGNKNIDAAYDYVTKEHGFAKKCSMASFSRGTLSLFRWASENPEKVESIYVDNGVLNIQSWMVGNSIPGSPYKAKGAPGSWKDFKRKFGYKTDAEAMASKESPIDMLEPLAKAGVPILSVCGIKDHAVRYDENDVILEQRYKALGGDITVIAEDKGHTHGMKDPKPILEFIRKHTPKLESTSTFPGEKGGFKGYVTYQFKLDNRVRVKVVCPKKAAPGKPWLWRSLFWSAIPKFYKADLKLVDEGYHVVLVHGDVSGHPSGNKNIDTAYKYLTTKQGFAKKCSMASMSRGTLSLFRWATENPEKVESIYVDNGVCNVLSWPAGKDVPGNKTISNGDPGSWKDFKRKFGYKTDAEALKTKESPIDLLAPLAKANVPILTVCGSKDHAVPYEENDAILERRYKALGGDITVIVENKGHSHGMKDPTPVLEFIRKHTLANSRSNNQK